MPGTDLPSLEDVTSALKTADFPADKDRLLAYAQREGADERVLGALLSLPLGDYQSRDEVLRSIDTVEATGSTPSQHAAQARTGDRPGLAQHQRSTSG
jgi:hypothetical protein